MWTTQKWEPVPILPVMPNVRLAVGRSHPLAQTAPVRGAQLSVVSLQLAVKGWRGFLSSWEG